MVRQWRRRDVLGSIGGVATGVAVTGTAASARSLSNHANVAVYDQNGAKLPVAADTGNPILANDVTQTIRIEAFPPDPDDEPLDRQEFRVDVDADPIAESYANTLTELQGSTVLVSDNENYLNIPYAEGQVGYLTLTPVGTGEGVIVLRDGDENRVQDHGGDDIVFDVLRSNLEAQIALGRESVTPGGSLQVSVTAAATGDPIGLAGVALSDTNGNVISDVTTTENGVATISVPSSAQLGEYSLETRPAGYQPITRSFEVRSPARLDDDLRLHAQEGQIISGVTSADAGTTYTIEIEGPGLLDAADATVQADGTFSAEFDLRSVSAGDQVTATIDGVDSVTYTVQSPPAATITMNPQVSQNGRVVTVREVFLPEGGYVVIHDATTGEVLGHTAHFEPGTYDDVDMLLDQPLAGDQNQVLAMAHMDTNGNQVYEFPDADGPYTANGEPVVDSAQVSVANPQTTATPTTTLIETPTTPPTTTLTETPTTPPREPTTAIAPSQPTTGTDGLLDDDSGADGDDSELPLVPMGAGVAASAVGLLAWRSLGSTSGGSPGDSGGGHPRPPDGSGSGSGAGQSPPNTSNRRPSEQPSGENPERGGIGREASESPDGDTADRQTAERSEGPRPHPSTATDPDTGPTDSGSEPATGRHGETGAALVASVRGLSNVNRLTRRGPLDVYTASYEGVADPVRVLALADDIESTDSMETRFRDAVHGWRNLSSHENVVTLHDWGTDPVPWLVTDLVSDTQPFTQSDAGSDALLDVLTEVADPINTASLYSASHGNLSGETLLVADGDQGPTGLVDDWGVARAIEDERSPPYVTPYTAPEQLEDGQRDRATEVFALGALAYEALTGEPPFPNTGDAAEHVAAVHRGPTPPSERSGSDPALNEPILRALAATPDQRQSSVTSLAAELRNQS